LHFRTRFRDKKTALFVKDYEYAAQSIKLLKTRICFNPKSQIPNPKLIDLFPFKDYTKGGVTFTRYFPKHFLHPARIQNISEQ